MKPYKQTPRTNVAPTRKKNGQVLGPAQVKALAAREGWEVFVPPLAYCTDNAAMIAMSGHFLYLADQHAALDTVPMPRSPDHRSMRS